MLSVTSVTVELLLSLCCRDVDVVDASKEKKYFPSRKALADASILGHSYPTQIFSNVLSFATTVTQPEKHISTPPWKRAHQIPNGGIAPRIEVGIRA